MTDLLEGLVFLVLFWRWMNRNVTRLEAYVYQRRKEDHLPSPSKDRIQGY